MKKDTHLDFTPLLDVIMILLFIIVASVGQRANITRESLKEVEAKAVELEEENSRLEAELSLSGEELLQMKAESDSLQESMDAVSQEYEEYRAVRGETADPGRVYDAVLNRVTKVSLICVPEQDRHTGEWSVFVEMYADNDMEKSQVYADSFQIMHDYELGKEEREKVNAEQELMATSFLKEHLADKPMEACYFSLQYPADNEYLSSLDIDILEKAVTNIQRELGIRCYVEKLETF